MARRSRLSAAQVIQQTVASGKPVRRLFSGAFGDWVERGKFENVTSSNVGAIAYDIALSQVKIEYKSGDTWGYDPIPIALAKGLYFTGSKGTWLWDYIRVRGKGNAHRHQVNARTI